MKTLTRLFALSLLAGILHADTGDIPISSNFQLSTGKALDARTTVTDSTARNAIPAVNRFDGLAVYQRSDSHTWQLQGSTSNWVDVTGGGGGGVSGIVQSAPQYNVPYYSLSGSSNTLTGSTNIQYSGSSVTVNVPLGTTQLNVNGAGPGTMAITGTSPSSFAYSGTSVTLNGPFGLYNTLTNDQRIDAIEAPSFYVNTTTDITNDHGAQTESIYAKILNTSSSSDPSVDAVAIHGRAGEYQRSNGQLIGVMGEAFGQGRAPAYTGLWGTTGWASDLVGGTTSQFEGIRIQAQITNLDGTIPLSTGTLKMIYLPDLTDGRGAPNQSWAIYSAATAPSWFAGNIGVGLTLPPAPFTAAVATATAYGIIIGSSPYLEGPFDPTKYTFTVSSGGVATAQSVFTPTISNAPNSTFNLQLNNGSITHNALSVADSSTNGTSITFGGVSTAQTSLQNANGITDNNSDQLWVGGTYHTATYFGSRLTSPTNSVQFVLDPQSDVRMSSITFAGQATSGVNDGRITYNPTQGLNILSASNIVLGTTVTPTAIQMNSTGGTTQSSSATFNGPVVQNNLTAVTLTNFSSMTLYNLGASQYVIVASSAYPTNKYAFAVSTITAGVSVGNIVSLPVQADASGNLTGSQISLSTAVTGSLPAASIASGSLGASVIASSHAVNSVVPSNLSAGSYTNITGVGTLTAGTWNGTALTSTYLPADVAYTDIAQTISAQKTFTAPQTLNSSVTVNNSLAISGGLSLTAANTVTTSYTAMSTDTVMYADATSGAITITLSSATFKQIQTVIKKDTSANPVNIQTAIAADTLVGGTTFYQLNARQQTLTTLGIGSNTLLKLYEQATPAYVGYTFPTTTSFVVAVSSDVFFAPFTVSSPVRLTSIRYSIAVAGTGSKTDFGVYSSTGGLLANVGSSAIGTAGVNTSTLSSAINLVPGTYYLAGTVNENTTSQLSGVQTTGGGGNYLCYRVAQAGTVGLPATITLPGTTGTKCFGMVGIVSGGAP